MSRYVATRHIRPVSDPVTELLPMSLTHPERMVRAGHNLARNLYCFYAVDGVRYMLVAELPIGHSPRTPHNLIHLEISHLEQLQLTPESLDTIERNGP